MALAFTHQYYSKPHHRLEMNRREILLPIFGILMLFVSSGLAGPRRNQDEICLTIAELEHIIEESNRGEAIWRDDVAAPIDIPNGRVGYPELERLGRGCPSRPYPYNDELAKEINIGPLGGSRSSSVNENKNVNINRLDDDDDDDLDSPFLYDVQNIAYKKRYPTASGKVTIPRRLRNDYWNTKNFNKNINRNVIKSGRAQRINNRLKYKYFGMPIGSRSLGGSRARNENRNVNENVNSNVNINKMIPDELDDY